MVTFGIGGDVLDSNNTRGVVICENEFDLVVVAAAEGVMECGGGGEYWAVVVGDDADRAIARFELTLEEERFVLGGFGGSVATEI